MQKWAFLVNQLLRRMRNFEIHIQLLGILKLINFKVPFVNGHIQYNVLVLLLLWQNIRGKQLNQVRDIAQSTKFLLFKNKDPCSVLSTHLKSQMWWCTLVTSTLERQRWFNPRVSVAHQPSLVNDPQIPVTTFVPKLSRCIDPEEQ